MTTIARVTGPADLAASVPEIIGFTPTESLVVLALKEPRGRLAMTMRFDLSASEVLVEEVPARLRQATATRTALLLHTDEEGDLPRAELMAELMGAVEDAGITVSEALLVRNGTWWSYTCSRACCPPQGSPVAPADRGAPGLMAAERVLQGGVVFDTREDLAASIAPVFPLGEDVRLAQLEVAAEDLLESVLDDRPRAERRAVKQLRKALRAPSALTEISLSRCVVSLRLTGVRDEVLAWVPAQAEQVQALMTVLARWTPRREAGAVLTVLGAAAYAQGAGALARIALEGAVETGEAQTFAALLLQALDRQVPPTVLRESLAPFQRQSRAAG